MKRVDSSLGTTGVILQHGDECGIIPAMSMAIDPTPVDSSLGYGVV